MPANDGSDAQAEANVADAFANPAPRTPNVAFTDPAMVENPTVNTSAQPVKKKTSKNTMIALVIVAAMVVIALGAVLILMANGTF